MDSFYNDSTFYGSEESGTESPATTTTPLGSHLSNMHRDVIVDFLGSSLWYDANSQDPSTQSWENLPLALKEVCQKALASKLHHLFHPSMSNAASSTEDSESSPPRRRSTRNKGLTSRETFPEDEPATTNANGRNKCSKCGLPKRRHFTCPADWRYTVPPNEAFVIEEVMGRFPWREEGPENEGESYFYHVKWAGADAGDLPSFVPLHWLLDRGSPEALRQYSLLIAKKAL